VKNDFEPIKSLMDANGIDKKTLAEIAGVGPSAVTKWSNGGCIRIQHIKKIAAYFNVSPARLMEQHLHDDTPKVKRSEVNWKLRALAAERKLENLRAAIRNFNKVVENLEGAL